MHTVPRAAKVVPQWVEEYLSNGHNGTAASIKCGFAKNSAHVMGSVMLKRPDVQALLKSREAEINATMKANTQLTVESVVGDLKAAHDFDPRGYFHDDFTHKHPLELTFEQAKQLEGWEVEETFVSKGRGKAKKLLSVRVIKIKLSKRVTVRDQGMRHLGLFAKDNPLNHKEPDEIAAAVRARLAGIDSSTGGRS
jgi:phage terminase small subunit